MFNLEQQMERRGNTSLYNYLCIGRFDTYHDAEVTLQLLQKQIEYINEGQGTNILKPLFRIIKYYS